MGFATFQDEVRAKFGSDPEQVIAEVLYQMHTPFKASGWFRRNGIQTYDETLRSWAKTRGWVKDVERGKGVIPPPSWVRSVAPDGIITWTFPEIPHGKRGPRVGNDDDDWDKVFEISPEELFRKSFDDPKEKKL